MPWQGATLIGTTETPYRGDPDRVQPLPEEEEYLLAVARRYFPAVRGMTRADILRRFAGLRVLPAASQTAFDRSRESIFTADRDPYPRVLGIYGGKLTGWRAAAAHVMERIAPSLDRKTQEGGDGSVAAEESTTMIKYGIAALGLGLLAGFAHADGDYASPTNDRVRVSLGAMRTSNSTTLQVDSSSGVPGTVINGESQFGLDASDIEPKFQVMLRAGERNRLCLDYFTLDRTGSAIVDATDRVSRCGAADRRAAAVDCSNLRLFTLTYGYSFWHSEKLEIAATLGITAVDISAQAKVQTASRPHQSAGKCGGALSDPGHRRHLGGEQTLLFGRPRSIPGRSRQSFRRIARLWPNSMRCTGSGPTCRSPWATTTSKRIFRRPKPAIRACSISAPRVRKYSSGSHSKASAATRRREPRSGRRHGVDHFDGLGSAANSTRLFAAAARFHSPAVSVSLRGGYGTPRARGAGIFEGDGDRTGGALADAGDQVGKCERLALLPRQRFLERVADQIAFAGRQSRAGRREAVGRIAAETKQAGRTGDFHHAAKALRLELRQQIAQHLEPAAIERYFAVGNRFDARQRRRGRRSRRLRRVRGDRGGKILHARGEIFARALQLDIRGAHAPRVRRAI